ncbi:alpha-1-antichymotrypsin [Sorex araneus]|uniref:alpha-1-antichymotrypsin n=1 Tax=Sorex araneus TaxID=42254 RepID=UPI0003316381|nr:alpha-1-antichymotrypsin [Sorex araneus]
MSVQLALLLGAALFRPTFCSISATGQLTGNMQKKISYQDHLNLAQRNGNFAVSLYRLLAAENPESNVIFSPVSISIALAVLALGTDSHITTEILQGLKFNLTETSEDDIHQGFQKLLGHMKLLGAPLQMYTAVFLDQQLYLLESFREKAWETYTGHTISIDFQDPDAAKMLINSYVDDNTQGKISKMVKQLDAETMLVLVNSVIFKAKWKMPFDPDLNFLSTFFLNQSKWTNVMTMRVENQKILFFWDGRYSLNIVKLPYSDGHISMLLILPDMGAMHNLETALSMDLISFWRNSMRPRKMTLYLPKFSITRSYNLEQFLPNLGITKVFSQEADFSRLSPARNLSISQVVHTAAVDLAEKGTEEAPFLGRTNPLTPRPLVIMNFNRPFMVVIFSEDTHNILFLGKVVNPEQE